jgi:biopolymer transport protein ExbD
MEANEVGINSLSSKEDLMSSTATQNSNRSMTEINIPPLIDVCLVLLIIIMLVTPIILKGFNVAPPPRATEEELGHARIVRHLLVTLTADGRIRLNQEEIPKEVLLSRLQDLLLRPTNRKTVYFTGEDEVSYNLAIEIMDIIRRAGATVVGVILDPVETA